MIFNKLIRKFFGSRNDRILQEYNKLCIQINSLEDKMRSLTVEELKRQTEILRAQLESGTSLKDLVVEAFATVREAARRTLNMRHFDVQLIGGMALNDGRIAEMRTGEGKTLVATLPAYLNALTGQGVHIVTVNDYLARRDAKWMQPIYEALGLTVGFITNSLEPNERQLNYACDVVYGTNNEFGFDYLRDNMAFRLEDKVQGKLGFAIIDEVDSILIDESRTPLIISGQAESSGDVYTKVNSLIPQLSLQQDETAGGDYTIDEKAKQAFLTEQGHEKIEELLLANNLLEAGGSLYDVKSISLLHHITASLKAHALFRRDVDYIVKDGKVVIVDEHTGRTMPGRRWSDGLHQAVEAKEGVEIEDENQTLASITFQNYFRLYSKLAGMTGTADTEAYEFQQIYGLEVVVIPPNRPSKRDDKADLIYLSLEDKFAAILADIKECRAREQPVLVGTISIETSELIAKILTKHKIPHLVLNAKFHAKEAEIIAEAGRPGAVTIATNMAGRGTDIVLGGSLEAELKKLPPDAPPTVMAATKNEWQARHDKVLAAGGLHIIGTERHESRRIDNQLRGRAGRQGDSGSSRFYLSVHDNLMRIFVSDKISSLLSKLSMKSGEAITHPWVTKAVENAQRKVEGHNFDVRKQLLEFDDVANEQRQVVYQQRRELLEAEDISETIRNIRQDVVTELLQSYIPPGSYEEQWDIDGLQTILVDEFGQNIVINSWLDKDSPHVEKIISDKLINHLQSIHVSKEELIGAPAMRSLEKSIMLNVLDSHWKDHLATMDNLRQSIHLRGYAGKDPKQEYKRESFVLFNNMLVAVKHDCVALLAAIEIKDNTAIDEPKPSPISGLNYNHGSSLNDAQEDTKSTIIREQPKIGRNSPCYCGSGKKYKQCHGKIKNKIHNDIV